MSPSVKPRAAGVVGVELDERTTLGRAVLGQVGVARVEESGVVLRVSAAGAGNDRRSDPAVPRSAARTSASVVDPSLERGRGELDLARLGRETAVGPRCAVVGERYLHPSVTAERVEVDVRQARRAGSSGRRRTATVRSGPSQPAIRRKHSVLLTASPSGSIAASFHPIHR